mmetsp:Transcript_32775/g.79722  ORF Transcript_32775/g.79722 Transcript_32775/m.79722 type:complete len:223 (+) Transcript_32775:1420-2088(+)
MSSCGQIPFRASEQRRSATLRSRDPGRLSSAALFPGVLLATLTLLPNWKPVVAAGRLLLLLLVAAIPNWKPEVGTGRPLPLLLAAIPNAKPEAGAGRPNTGCWLSKDARRDMSSSLVKDAAAAASVLSVFSSPLGCPPSVPNLKGAGFCCKLKENCVACVVDASPSEEVAGPLVPGSPVFARSPKQVSQRCGIILRFWSLLSRASPNFITFAMLSTKCGSRL